MDDVLEMSWRYVVSGEVGGYTVKNEMFPKRFINILVPVLNWVSK